MDRAPVGIPPLVRIIEVDSGPTTVCVVGPFLFLGPSVGQP